MKIYPRLGGVPTENNLTWKFPSGAKIKFSHLQHEKNKYDHQSAAYVFIGFDELPQFTSSMFFYLLTRNSAPSGYDRPVYCRCTGNPEPGWVADLIQWWWDPETGYAIPERSGVIRYYTRIEDQIIWVDKNWRGVGADGKEVLPKSFTFIPAMLRDNPIYMEQDPAYESNLMAQDMVTRERLLKGNWKISYSGECSGRNGST